MSAIQKSRKPFEDADRAFEDKTLIESGNEIQICQKIEMSMGGYPDPTNTGVYKSVAVSYDSATRVLTLSSSAEGSKFKAGDEIVVYNVDDLSRNKIKKNCVKLRSGENIELFDEIIGIPGDITIEKNLVFRGSNINTYRTDEYGVKRFFPAIASTSEIQSSMGEMFEYKWDRSDFSFSFDNYDKKFNQYLPGGENHASFALKEVNVFFGFGEEYHKNRLVFTGVTNLNNGISEDNEVLKLTAYDSSYLYNIPVSLNTFTQDILDNDYKGKPIPVLYGDYTSIGAFVSNNMKPIIPAVLTKMITTLHNSHLIISGSSLGITSSFKITSYSPLEGYDGNEIELVYSREEKDGSFAASCVKTLISGSKYRYTVTLYRGKKSTGLLYSSTSWIYLCLMSDATFAANWAVAGYVNQAITEYKNMVVPYDNSGSTDDIIKSDVYKTNGGQSERQCYYKICSNGLSSDTTNFSFASNTGSWDAIEDWDAAPNMLKNKAVTHLKWNTDSGELLFVPHSDLTTAEILAQKVYVYVAGKNLYNATIKKDDLLVLNVANATITPKDSTYSDVDKSGNGAICTYVGTQLSALGGDFSMGGYRSIVPYSVTTQQMIERTCWSLLGFVQCSRRQFAKITTKYSYLSYNLKHISDLGGQDFVFDLEFQRQVNPDYLVSKINIPGTVECLFSMGTNSDMGIYGTFDSSGVFVFNYKGQIATTTTAIDPLKVYAVRVKKTGTNVKVYIRSVTDFAVFTEEASITITNATSDDVNLLLLGSKSLNPSAESGKFFGRVGMCRFRVGGNAFLHEDFTIYGTQNADGDIISIAKDIIKMSGADDSFFDTTWDLYYLDKINQSYEARHYINKDDLKTIDAAVELLGQLGIVLTMKEERGKMKFSLIWDNLEFYEKGKKKITAYDIEMGSVNVERELNQYFNTTKGEYNYNPSADELASKTGSLYEPNAVKRDGNLNVWFMREDKGFGSFEFPAIYNPSDANSLLKNIIANSTPNAEMITCNLSWRHLMLQVGEFCVLNYGRYKNVPVQVRSVKLDANGSSIEVKFRSLENVNFLDRKTNIEFIPQNYDNIGGKYALTTITNRTDVGDE